MDIKEMNEYASEGFYNMYNKEADYSFLGFCVFDASKPFYMYYKV